MSTDEQSAKRRSPWGLAGVIVACVALAAAFLSPWIAEAIDPSPPLEEVVADKAVKIRDAMKAKLAGKEYVAERRVRVGAVLPPVVIAAGLAGAGLGLVSLFKRETRMFSASAMTIGISAVAVQWMVVVAAAIIGLLVLYLIFSFLTGGGA
jgi:hypothetical protein